VHALVAAVLLWTAWLDALDGNAKAQPPHRELREVEQRVGAGEGHAVVGANGGRQAALEEELLEEELLEGGDGGLLPDGLECFAHQQEAGGVVSDGEVVAVLAIASLASRTGGCP
jgi:hypothetical protein